MSRKPRVPVDGDVFFLTSPFIDQATTLKFPVQGHDECNRDVSSTALKAHQRKEPSRDAKLFGMVTSQELRGNAVSNRVVVVGGVIADCKPAAIRF